MEKTFVLGMGVQKSGTSWAHRLMAESPNFNLGFRKEYHVWDAVDIPLLAKNRVQLKLEMNLAQRTRYLMQAEPDTYFAYFASLLKGPENITADMTPSHSGLSRQTLEIIRTGFASHGINCKVVLLLRDPVDRCKSAVHFNLNRGNFSEGVSRKNTSFCAALAEYALSDHAEIRTRYDRTIENIRAVFSPENVYIGLYESMFEKDKIAQFSAFLGVENHAELAGIRVNETLGQRPICAEVEAALYARFAGVYAYCNTALPETKTLWRQPPA